MSNSLAQCRLHEQYCILLALQGTVKSMLAISNQVIFFNKPPPQSARCTDTVSLTPNAEANDSRILYCSIIAERDGLTSGLGLGSTVSNADSRIACLYDINLYLRNNFSPLGRLNFENLGGILNCCVN